MLPRMPSERNAFIVWCLMAFAVSASVAVSPTKFFRMLSRNDLPKVIENRWVLILYRVTAVAMLIWIVQMLFKLFTT